MDVSFAQFQEGRYEMLDMGYIEMCIRDSRKGALSYDEKVVYKNDNTMMREDIIRHITDVSGEDPVISTTGKASRELFEIREAKKMSHKYDFLTVGSMGHLSLIHISTGKVPVVYMQNSGEGNIINPVASLLNDKVYAIPMIFVVGWRGEPGVHDEPQHIYQGEVTIKLLEDMDIKPFIVGKETTEEELKAAMDDFKTVLAPVSYTHLISGKIKE